MSQRRGFIAEPSDETDAAPCQLLTGPTQRFAKARIEAQLNVPPGDFIDDHCTDGASSELAACALYGDYASFVPVTSLAAIDEDGAIAGDGLVIDAVDDISLRVDYLSVAR